MKTAIRFNLGCGILALGLFFTQAASLRAQEPRIPGNQAPAAELIWVSQTVAVLDGLPWNLPEVARACIDPEQRRLQAGWSQAQAVSQFRNSFHSHWHHESHLWNASAYREGRAFRW